MTSKSEATTKRAERRRQRLVLRAMQSRLILHATALPLVALTLLTLSVTILGREVIADASASEVALPHLERLLIALVCLTPAMAGAILYVAFRFSHRVAGPTYRLVESLKRIQSRDFDFEVHLRPGDYLTEIADELNETLAALRGEVGGEAPGRVAEGPEPMQVPLVENGQGPPLFGKRSKAS